MKARHLQCVLGLYMMLTLPVTGSIGADSSPVWQAETVERTGKVPLYVSLALDPAGHPHIGYCDFDGQQIKYLYYDGSAWRIETLQSELCSGLSLAIDSTGHPHISYYYSERYYLHYAYYDGTTWRTMTVDNTWTWGGEGSTSLVLDQSGHPRISYWSGTALKYAWYDGRAWHIEVVDSTAGSVKEYTALALDHAGRPHIAYADGLSGNLQYARYDGGAWHIETVDHMGCNGDRVSLALDADDRPHISYSRIAADTCTNDGLEYAWRGDTAWHIEVVDDAGAAGAYPSLKLDRSDRPHISYCVHSQLGCAQLKYAYYNGSDWYIEIVDTEGDVTGDYSSLGLDASDSPHIGYGTDSGLAYAYRLLAPVLPCTGGTAVGTWAPIVAIILIGFGLALRRYAHRRAARR